MVGLVRHSGLNPFHLTQSHQVLAYAYDVAGDAVTLRIYDPNWPGRDDVDVAICKGGLTQSSDEELTALLRLNDRRTSVKTRAMNRLLSRVAGTRSCD